MSKVINDKGKRFIETIDDEYRITISEDGVHVMVENLSVEGSCAINIFKNEVDEDGSIKAAFDKEDWDQFVRELISIGYLE